MYDARIVCARFISYNGIIPQWHNACIRCMTMYPPVIPGLKTKMKLRGNNNKKN